MTVSAAAEPAANRRAVMAVLLVVFLDMTAFGLLLPSLPFLNEQLGGSPSVLGWIIASFSLGQLIGSPLLGQISDRVGRKPVLAASILVGVVGNVMYAMAPTPMLLVLSRAIAGAAAGNLSVARAYIAEVTVPERRTAAMGLAGAAFGLGFMVGPGIGALVADLGLRAPGWISAGLNGVNLIYLWIVVREPTRIADASSGRFGALNRRRLAILIIGMYFTAIAGFAGFETVAGLVTKQFFHWTNRENGLLFGGGGLVAVLVQGGLIRPLSRRIEDRYLLLAGYLLMLAGFATLATQQMLLPRFLAGALCLGVGMSLSQPSLFAMFSRISSMEGQGAAMGWLNAGGSLARIAGPLWAGYAFGIGNARLAFWGMALAVSAALVLYAVAAPQAGARTAQPDDSQ